MRRGLGVAMEMFSLNLLGLLHVQPFWGAVIGALRSGHLKVDPRGSIDVFHRLCKEGLLSHWDCEKHQDPTPGLSTPASIRESSSCSHPQQYLMLAVLLFEALLESVWVSHGPWAEHICRSWRSLCMLVRKLLQCFLICL